MESQLGDCVGVLINSSTHETICKSLDEKIDSAYDIDKLVGDSLYIPVCHIASTIALGNEDEVDGK